ncbi:9235_t:CDS:2 [Entrophospora sp. SA101]|nr:10784_t:CDS:2 [Entrophospora sp. SA101]CAJ0843725.1 9235_t:CDS:2 [Entrophospora sp. SA101]CAJ0855036.1 9835_t:CDS:2 [Entrophospora sp. SA101]CAJ0855096.1 9841_t:CDS:2 [Entrophospora sp. SA101]CAJ0855130.1 9844_t:CDS:2 [Entrophospora sp. SA101]
MSNQSQIDSKHRNIRNIVTQSKVDQEYDQYAGQIIKLAIFGV